MCLYNEIYVNKMKCLYMKYIFKSKYVFMKNIFVGYISNNMR